jgi:glucose/arabinose dehydrogenase
MVSRFAIILLAGLAISGCDNRPPPSPSPSPNPQPQPDERITGNERLGWDQQAGDAVELATFRYAIYVDTARFELAGVSCSSTSGATGFPCSARLPTMAPGSHTLELAAFVVDGATVIESGRSASIRVVVGTSAIPGAPVNWESDLSLTTTDGQHLRIELVTRELDEPTALAFASDDQIFIAERAGRVRTVRHGELLSDPALTLDDVLTSGGGGLLAVATDPQFERTGFVYAVYTAPSRYGDAIFRLARFRDAGGTLADRAVLLDGVPSAAAEPRAGLRFGADDKLYVVFDDAGDPSLRDNFASFNGKILRLNHDATTPDDNVTTRPTFAHGFRSPRGFDWQNAQTLWIADGFEAGFERLTAVATDGRTMRGAVGTTYALPAGAGASALAFYDGDLMPAFRGDLLIAADEGHHVLRLRFDRQTPTRIIGSERLLQDRVGPIRVVAAGPRGEIYFATPDAVGRIVPD